MRIRPPAIVAIATALIAAPAVQAWDNEGHAIVAYIAYQSLKPEVRKRVNDLLHKHPQYDELLVKGCPAGFDPDLFVFMKAATWPDMMRSERNDPGLIEHHPRWHYVNLPVKTDDFNGEARSPDGKWTPGDDPENILQALEKCEADLGDPTVSDEERAKRLCWALHLVGDIHQPLHTVALFSPQFPKGDHGGNSFGVTEDGKPYELHAYWDQVLGKSDSAPTIEGRAAGLLARPVLARSQFADELKRGAYQQWADEGVLLATAVTYQNLTLKGQVVMNSTHLPADAPPLPEKYREKATTAAERQVVLAGYRLGNKLEELFRSSRD